MALKKEAERGFKYQKRDKETLKERANMKGGNFDTIFKPKYKQWKPKDGKNLIRVLPPTWDDARHYGLDIFINYNIGADNQSYLSLAKHGKGEDPLEEARREAQKEGDKDLAKALSPNQRILYWIIDRNDEEEGPLLWAAPFTFDKSLANLCIDEDTKDVLMIDDPGKGRDVRFYKEGSGLLTKYDPSKMKVLAPSTLAEEEELENDWLDFIQDNPLTEVLNFYDYDHIKATFDGQIGKRDDDDDEKPVRGKKRGDDEEKVNTRGTNRTRPRAEPDEDPPEEDEKPARGKRSRAEPDPEDDEPAPARRGRTKPDEDEPAPRRSRARAEPDPEEESDPESPTRSRRGKTESDDEGGGSLRDKIARRRSRPDPDDDD